MIRRIWRYLFSFKLRQSVISAVCAYSIKLYRKERDNKMKKKLRAKACFLGFAALAAGAAVSAPALIPSQAFAATETAQAVEATTADLKTETESKTVVWTIRCVYKLDNGSVKPVKSTDGSDFKVTRSATFTRSVTKDAKTGKVVSAGDWAAPVKLAGYEAPAIQGYVPDKTYIDGITVAYDSKPADTVIYYTEKPENKKTPISEDKDVSRKITYYRINDDGSVTQIWRKTQRVTFTRSGTVDGNGKKVFAAWMSHTWAAEAVSVDGMEGYTPDKTTIPAVTFTPDNPPGDVNVYFRKNIEDVIDPGETKILDAVVSVVTFTDGQGKVLKTDQVESGKAAVAPAAPVREGYTFDYWKGSRYEDGRPVISTENKPCQEYIEQTFNRVGLKDTVTGKITYWSDWAPEKTTFSAVTPITVQGYTPNVKQISAVTVTPDTKSWEVKVYYSKNGSSTIGKVVDTYTGVRYQNGAWTYVKKGNANYSFTGVALSTTGNWVFIRNGRYDASYTGVALSTTGSWVYVKNGRYNTAYTGVARSTTGNWVFVRNGRFDASYTGVAQSTTGNWVYVKNGRYNTAYTGVARSTTGNWVFVKNGRFTPSYTGYTKNSSGQSVYVVNGRLK